MCDAVLICEQSLTHQGSILPMWRRSQISSVSDDVEKIAFYKWGGWPNPNFGATHTLRLLAGRICDDVDVY